MSPSFLYSDSREFRHRLLSQAFELAYKELKSNWQIQNKGVTDQFLKNAWSFYGIMLEEHKKLDSAEDTAVPSNHTEADSEEM